LSLSEPFYYNPLLPEHRRSRFSPI
jgi:hypothetical protein